MQSQNAGVYILYYKFLGRDTVNLSLYHKFRKLNLLAFLHSRDEWMKGLDEQQILCAKKHIELSFYATFTAIPYAYIFVPPHTPEVREYSRVTNRRCA